MPVFDEVDLPVTNVGQGSRAVRGRRPTRWVSGGATLSYLVLFALAMPRLWAADWIRAGIDTNRPIWGIRGGLVWAIHPAGFRGHEPRGLIRLGYPILPEDQYDLVNFIAIEPIVRGRRGFSELEHSRLDPVRGKRIWAEDVDGPSLSGTNLFPGRLTRPHPGVEQLEVPLGIETFDNGAKVQLNVIQRSDAPDEIEFVICTTKESAPLEYCILTATMGNLARTRQLWLKDKVVSSLELYGDYRGTGFAPHRFYALDRLHRTGRGDVLVAVTTDEDTPATIFPIPHSRAWHYGGTKVTQYWREAKDSLRADVHVAVNARYTYWQSRRPIPGGAAFENFELRESFHEGQVFVFGISRRTPAELGFEARP